MNTLMAYMNKLGAKDQPMMFFDWEKAVNLIKKHEPVKAFAGLEGDFEWTGADIYANGKPILVDEEGDKPYTFLGSCWATPVLVLTDEDGCESDYECYTRDPDKGYDTGTYWPEDALASL